MMEKTSLFIRPESRRIGLVLKQIVFLVLLFIALQRIYSVHHQYKYKKHSTRVAPYPPHRGYEMLQSDAWKNLAQALDSSRPRLSSTLRMSAKVTGKPIEALQEEEEEEEEADVVQLDFKSIASLRIRHTRFQQYIKTKAIPVIYRDSERGIVVTGTAQDLPAILVQLRLLRRTRSKLPVEVFLLTEDDYDHHICDRIFPALQAQCRVLETLMSSASLPFVHNQRAKRQIMANEPLHKLLAIFFSNYQDILMLGYDTLLYNNPDMIFREEPYLSRGLVMWPDFWASSISPKLSQIQGKETPNTIDKSRTVDMGQMMISKIHAREALLLSIYYTYFGPGLYDVLLKQSDAGEAGSQAIKAAARYFDIPFYMVKRLVEAVGYPDMDLKGQPFRGVAMLQSYAKEDYFRLSKDKHIPAFIRANNPVLDPTKILTQGVTTFSSSHNITAHRMWEWFGGRYVSNGWRDPDPEQAVWDEMANVACNDLALVEMYKPVSKQLCYNIDEHIKQLGMKRNVLY